MQLSRPSLRKARIEMVPLIDSFFLLLAFFVSSVLSMSVLGGLPVELPAAANAARLDQDPLTVVTIGREGQLELDGHAVSLGDLPGRLKADARMPTLRVAVRADRLVQAGRLLEVLGVIRGAGARRVGLVASAVTESEASP